MDDWNMRRVFMVKKEMSLESSHRLCLAHFYHMGLSELVYSQV